MKILLNLAINLTISRKSMMPAKYPNRMRKQFVAVHKLGHPIVAIFGPPLLNVSILPIPTTPSPWMTR